MPVSMVCDSSIVSAAIRDSLAPSVSTLSADAFISADSLLDANVRGANLTKIEYEEVGSYTSVLENLKSKYTVFRPINTNGLAKSPALTNGINKPAAPAAHPESGNTQKLKEKVNLPVPSRSLYPRSKITVGWKNGPHRFNIGSGMANMGNTCYLNSSLQALMHIPSLANWLMSDKPHRENCSLMNAGEYCSICALSKTLIDSQEARDTIRPTKIYHSLRHICKHLMMGRQEDAHEFLRFLLESCEQAFIKRFPDHKQFDPYIKQTTPINNIFGGYFRVEIKCTKCHYISTSFQYFMDLILDVNSQQFRTLEDSLDQYFKREPLSDGWTCPQCKKNVCATKQWLIERQPIVVCIQLKKFTQSGMKVSKPIEIKPEIDLSPYMADGGSKKISYKLVSVVNHIGASINCGHYTASCLTEGGSYFKFDDSMVNPTSVGAALNSTAYVLFYELSEPLQKQVNGIKPTSVATTSSSPVNGQSNRILALHNGQNTHDAANGTTTPVKKQSIPFIGPLLPSDSDKEKEPVKIEGSFVMNSTKVSPHTKMKHNSQLVTNILSKNKLLGSSFKDENKTPSKIVLNLNKQLASSSSYAATSSHVTANGSSTPEKRPILPSMPALSPDSNKVIENGHNNNGSNNLPKTPIKSLVPYNSSDNEDDDDDEHSTLSPASPLGGKSPCVIETKAGIWKVSDNSRSSSPATGKTNGHNHNKNGSNDVVSQLVQNSHQGYGTSNVSSWSGGKTAMNTEIMNEKRMERKRLIEDEIETELDRGHVKKIKPHFEKSVHNENGSKNAFQEYQNYQNTNNNFNNNHRSPWPSKQRFYHNNHSNYNRNNNNKNYHYHNNSNNRNFARFKNSRYGEHKNTFYN